MSGIGTANLHLRLRVAAAIIAGVVLLHGCKQPVDRIVGHWAVTTDSSFEFFSDGTVKVNDGADVSVGGTWTRLEDERVKLTVVGYRTAILLWQTEIAGQTLIVTNDKGEKSSFYRVTPETMDTLKKVETVADAWRRSAKESRPRAYFSSEGRPIEEMECPAPWTDGECYRIGAARLQADLAPLMDIPGARRYMDAMPSHDGWRNEIEFLVRYTKGGRQEAMIRSLGADGVANTNDDIVRVSESL